MITDVLVFDDEEAPAAITDPNATPGDGETVVVAVTGPRGPKGDPGDENVIVLGPGEELDPETPAGKIVYQLLE